MSDPKTVAGRPAGFSREEAVSRAKDLFWRNGYLSVTARDLAAAMNIQRSSFYNTFGGKDAVFAEALAAYAQETPDAALENIGPGQAVIPSIIAMLRKLCRVRAADKYARGCLVCNSVAELVGVDEKFGASLEARVLDRIGLMSRLFEQAHQQGEFSPATGIGDIAKSFVAFLLGVNIVSKTIRSEQDLWAICRTFLLGIGVDEKALS